MGLDIAGLGSVADLAKSIIDKLFPNKVSETERAQAELAIQTLIMQHDESTDSLRRDVIVTELNQTDNFTKRARPAVIYFGLLVIFVNYCIFPYATYFGTSTIETIELPTEFWVVWGSISSVWMIGRTSEKIKGVANMITGK